MLGLPASVLGNEVATRLGRRPVLIGFMLTSLVVAAVIGFAALLPFWWMAALLAVYGVTVMLDSASLTVGALGAAAPGGAAARSRSTPRSARPWRSSRRSPRASLWI